MPEYTPDDATTESILRALVAGRTLQHIAKKHGVPLRDLAHWSVAGAGADAITDLRTLARARASLALTVARTRAAVALARLARDTDAKETSRKACYDLLRLPEPMPEPHPEQTPADNDDLTPEEFRAWLDALESLGKTSAPGTTTRSKDADASGSGE